ncbi:MAG: bifunctional diaminohydroxyphosphoribosylaminopyrimidine deaminase/5-amino-6-(5-phosphoribosylamino)uracil reductase RibD [Gemmatales bacterium]|nr:bifunctional diaminohydroxyphosphoribosylaminopyrimidine deaminase/5-amino-6-(5-phosphoribosylamino)uracil reductase RibD [Gemmatales bacterium]MDW8386929.1 bifunctional diaminohydroxyphosphoribosylaminopyrimidine deaminase/5-amino-6-(5-phosphoribosylamino)uracil reductase RibD [Gemmatales bacterium]
MREALLLAERGRGYVEPNPLVGAVVVREGRIVGSGWHQRFGGPHAEIYALEAAGESARGATLYVTLEPCCHHGKTPPCTDAILKAGISRVVAAMSDPFPEVAGKGIAILKEHGVPVEVGILSAEAEELNAPYLKLVRSGRPYVIAKWAMSLDGRIATATGDSRWISGEESRRKAHEVRGRVDGILVGIGTVLADDPLLTARPPGPRTACRIILDSCLRLPLTSRLVQTVREAPVLVFHEPQADAESKRRLEAAGCECLPLRQWGRREAIGLILDELGRRRFTNILVEGGAEVLGSFVETRQVDELMVFVAPMIVGGRSALGPVGGRGAATLREALRLARWTVEPSGEDWLIRARLGAASAPSCRGTS